MQQVKKRGGRPARVGTPQPMDYEIFTQAIRVLTGRFGYYTDDRPGGDFYRVAWDSYRKAWTRGSVVLTEPRWVRRTMMRVHHENYPTHPVVEELLPVSRPWDWHLLLLEFPAYSVDLKRIAYFRNERDLMEGRRTVTSVAKYVQRHWGGLVPDHVIRDIAAKYTAYGFRVVTSSEEMVALTRVGPHSCQRWGRGDCKPSTVGDSWESHPYQAYDPAKGWGLVVQEVNGEIKSRCLVYSGPAADGAKVYVRIYGNDPETSAWLASEGYELWDGWPEGAEIRACDPWPYLDGVNSYVDWNSGDAYATISSDGYELSDTDGEGPMLRSCDDCGERISRDDDLYTVYNGDEVCECCRDDYIHARNRHGDYEYYPASECIEVDDEWYYIRHASECGIVQDYDDEWRNADDCVYCVDVDGYVLADEATYHEPDGEYYLNPPDDEPEEDEDEDDSTN